MENLSPQMEDCVPTEAGDSPVRKRSVVRSTISWIRDLAVSIVLAIVVILFLYQPVKVEGTSMMPALVDQDRIFINKFIYRFGLGDINRGDLVVFRLQGEPNKSYIKRVVGLPGDTIEVRDGAVIVNGQALNEPYVPSKYRDRISKTAVKIQGEQYYLLGDHRSSSRDSRIWGPVHRRYIYGKAVFVYWPLQKIGLLN
jgi:signal peptidase I